MKALLVPFFVAGLLNFVVGMPTYRTFGIFTDHLSHMMTVFLFIEHGLDVYEKKSSDLCPIKQSPEITRFNERWMIPPMDRENTCQMKQGGRVLFINWPHMTRPYPVGEILWFAPAAMMFSLTDTVPGVAQLLIWQFLLCAGLGMLIFTKGKYFLSASRKFEMSFWAGVACIALASISAMGFYDGLAFWLVVGSIIHALEDKKKSGEIAIVLFAAACLFHYRAVWYFPVCLFAGQKLFSVDRFFWRRPAVLLAGMVLLFSVYSLWKGLPSIRSLEVQNPLLRMPAPVLLHLLPPLVLLTILLLKERNFLGVIVLGTCLLFSALTPLAQVWYMLFWLPLGLIILRPDRKTSAFWPFMILLAALDQNVYRFFIFSGGAFPSEILRLFAGDS